ncbi:MAG: hypothetical protein QMC70_09690 [Bacteroidia bacterium]
MFQNVLSKAQEGNFMVSISTYGEDATWVGYILSHTLELVTIEHVSKFGRYDGIRTLKIDNIERVDVNDELCRSITFLAQNQNEMNNLSIQYKEKQATSGSFLDMLTYCKEENLICSIDTKELYLTCFVLELSTDEIQLLAIDNFGNKDGECHIKMDDINFVSMGRLTAMRRLLLYNLNYRI